MILLTKFVYKRFKQTKVSIFDKKRENVGIKHLNNPNAFIECSNTMDDIYEDINDSNPIKKEKN